MYTYTCNIRNIRGTQNLQMYIFMKLQTYE